MATKIYNINDLQNIRFESSILALDYELANDIDASATATWNWDGEKYRGFQPICWPYPQIKKPLNDFWESGTWTSFPNPGRAANVWDWDFNGDASYISCTSSQARILFTSPSFTIPLGSTDIDILFTGIVKAENPTSTSTIYRYGYAQVGGTKYRSPWSVQSAAALPDYTRLSFREFYTNPKTGLDWTVDEINGVGPNALEAWGLQTSGRALRFTAIQCFVRCKLPESATRIFDGKGYTIKNLYMDRDTSKTFASYGGIMAWSCGGSFKDITLENVDIKGVSAVGSLAGYADECIGFENCNASGTLEATTTSWSELGGIVGMIYGWNRNTRISNCHFTGELKGFREIGGITGFLSGGTYPEQKTIIENCSFDGKIDAPTGYCHGGIAGYCSRTDISHCESKGIIDCVGQAGGIVGETYYMGNVEYCHSNMEITTGNDSGGLIGYWSGWSNDITVFRCYAEGNVIGSDRRIGGLIGEAVYGIIKDCYSTVCVVGTYSVGGLIGECNWEVTIDRCFASGNVFGTEYYVGGLVGDNDYGNIKNSYTTGLVKGNRYVGGLIGWGMGDVFWEGGLVDNCYSVGKVESWGENPDFIGGFCGGTSVTYSLMFSNCFWDIETSGIHIAIGEGSGLGIQGKFTEQMKDIYTFLGASWDISEVNDELNDGYPFLCWQLFWV